MYGLNTPSSSAPSVPTVPILGYPGAGSLEYQNQFVGYISPPVQYNPNPEPWKPYAIPGATPPAAMQIGADYRNYQTPTPAVLGGVVGLPFPGMNPNVGTYNLPSTATRSWLA